MNSDLYFAFLTRFAFRQRLVPIQLPFVIELQGVVYLSIQPHYSLLELWRTQLLSSDKVFAPTTKRF